MTPQGFAVGVGISLGGYGLLLSLLGILTGVTLIAVGVRMADSPTAFGTTTFPAAISMLLTVRPRGNLAVVGLVVASSAIAASAGEASPAICFGLFATFLAGISLLNAGLRGA